MSIDNLICVPTGASNQLNGNNTKYRSGNLGLLENYTQHQVSLTHGANLLIDGHYVFRDEMDARWFWEEGCKERLFNAGSDGETCDHERMSLWLNGMLEADRGKHGDRL